MAVVELYLFCLYTLFNLITEVASGSYIITLLQKYMIAIGAVTGLIYLFCHLVSFKLCSGWLFWHHSDHISVYKYMIIDTL